MPRKSVLSILGLCFALNGVAGAQIPIPPISEKCRVQEELVDEPDSAETKGFGYKQAYALPGVGIVTVPGICEQYTRAGWEEPMKLWLGEGASAYRDLIELAVRKWNEAIRASWEDPLIEIVDGEPENFRLSNSFWEDDEEEIDVNIDDGENVIYFTSGGDSSYEDSYRGFAYTQRSGTRMVDADLYINTAVEEEWDGHTLAYTKKMIEAGSSYGVYAFINSTYGVILHEIGHAVGLKHLSITGNVMKGSGALVDGTSDQWAPAMNLYQIEQARGQIGAFDIEDTFVTRNSSVFPYMVIRKSNQTLTTLVDFYTERTKLGEAEKMFLNCIYEQD